MKAVLHTADAFDLAEDVKAERMVWIVPTPLRGSRHRFKYRLALVAFGECVLRYDNEAGKGDHRHAGNSETPYDFVDVDQLFVDFWEDVYQWISQHFEN